MNWEGKFLCWDVAWSAAWIEMAVARVARAEEEEDEVLKANVDNIEENRLVRGLKRSG